MPLVNVLKLYYFIHSLRLNININHTVLVPALIWQFPPNPHLCDRIALPKKQQIQFCTSLSTPEVGIAFTKDRHDNR